MNPLPDPVTLKDKNMVVVTQVIILVRMHQTIIKNRCCFVACKLYSNKVDLKENNSGEVGSECEHLYCTRSFLYLITDDLSSNLMKGMLSFIPFHC